MNTQLTQSQGAVVAMLQGLTNPYSVTISTFEHATSGSYELKIEGGTRGPDKEKCKVCAHTKYPEYRSAKFLWRNGNFIHADIVSSQMDRHYASIKEAVEFLTRPFQ